MGQLEGRDPITDPRTGKMHIVKAGNGVPAFSYFILWEDIVVAMKEDHPVIVPIVANVASLPATAKVGKPYFVRDVGAIYVYDIDGQWKGSQILDVEEDGIAYVRKDKTWVPATDVEHNTDKIIPIDSIAESVSEIASNQQQINQENKTAIFTIRDAIRRLAGAAVTINIGATPQAIGIVETNFDFVTSFPSTNEDVITTDDTADTITLKLDGRYQFGTYAVFTNPSPTTDAIITLRTRFTDNNGINTERNITVPKNSTYIAPITNVPFDLTGSPRTIKITFQSNISGVNITQFETTLTTSAGTVASGGGAGLPDTWYTDNAAVRAIEGYADGYDVGVYATGAIYEFSAVLTNADDDDTYLKPDDIAVGDPGRWVKRKVFSVSGHTHVLSTIIPDSGNANKIPVVSADGNFIGYTSFFANQIVQVADIDVSDISEGESKILIATKTGGVPTFGGAISQLDKLGAPGLDTLLAETAAWDGDEITLTGNNLTGALGENSQEYYIGSDFFLCISHIFGTDATNGAATWRRNRGQDALTPGLTNDDAIITELEASAGWSSADFKQIITKSKQGTWYRALSGGFLYMCIDKNNGWTRIGTPNTIELEITATSHPTLTASLIAHTWTGYYLEGTNPSDEVAEQGQKWIDTANYAVYERYNGGYWAKIV